MDKKDNVLKVPPRRYQVNRNGLHGYVEYKPTTKRWYWTFKAQLTIKNEGDALSKEAAELELKKFMDAAAVSKNVRSID